MHQLHHLLHTSITPHRMPRAQDIVVSNAVKGIAEVVVTHTKTRSGIVHTREKVIPVVLSGAEWLGQSSKAKKGSPSNPKPNLQGYSTAIPTEGPTEYTEAHQFPEEHEYSAPDLTAEDCPPQVTVCTPSDLYEWTCWFGIVSNGTMDPSPQ